MPINRKVGASDGFVSIVDIAITTSLLNLVIRFHGMSNKAEYSCPVLSAGISGEKTTLSLRPVLRMVVRYDKSSQIG